MSSGSRRRDGGGHIVANYHAARLPGLYCCTVSDEGPPRARVHDRLFVLTLTAGEALVWCCGETYALAPGALLMVGPGGVHRDIRKTPYSAVIVEVRTDLLKTLYGPSEEPWLGSSVTRCDALCGQVIALVDSVRARHELAVQQRQVARLIRLLAAVGTGTAPRPEPPLVARARRALSESAGSSLSLDELAGRLRCAPTYLCRVFSAHTGVGPHAYQLQQRLLEARKLVESGQMIAAVAARTGFGDESHLRRHFRRRFAVAPGRYQKELAAVAADRQCDLPRW